MLTREQLVTKLGIENSTKEKQDEILQQLANAISNRILLRLGERLTDQDLEEVSKIIDSGNEAAVDQYFYDKFPDFEQFKSKIENEYIDEVSESREVLYKAMDEIKKEQVAK